MVWDKTKPQDSTKIRNLGNVITPNWDAIESAADTFMPQAINFADRTPLGVPSDPAVLAATVKLYSKQDTASKPQLYAIDPDSVKTQLTGFTVTNTGTNYGIKLPWGVTMNWGKYTLTAGTAETGLLTFKVPFATQQSITFTQAGGTASTLGATAFTATQFKIKRSSSAGALTVYYFAIGV